MTDAAIASPAAPAAPAPTTPAAPAAPATLPAGFPVAPSAFDAPEAVAARAEIKAKIGDSEFYKTLKAEKESGVSGPASKAWAELHAKGWPMAPGVSSQADVNAQADARVEGQWHTVFQGLNAQWSVSPEQEAEMRAGVVREDIRNFALQQRDLMIKDKAFYRRLLDGDMAAKEKWGRVVAVIGLRPVKVT
jgi:hypothetical protein